MFYYCLCCDTMYYMFLSHEEFHALRKLPSLTDFRVKV